MSGMGCHVSVIYVLLPIVHHTQMSMGYIKMAEDNIKWMWGEPR